MVHFKRRYLLGCTFHNQFKHGQEEIVYIRLFEISIAKRNRSTRRVQDITNVKQVSFLKTQIKEFNQTYQPICPHLHAWTIKESNPIPTLLEHGYICVQCIPYPIVMLKRIKATGNSKYLHMAIEGDKYTLAWQELDSKVEYLPKQLPLSNMTSDIGQQSQQHQQPSIADDDTNLNHMSDSDGLITQRLLNITSCMDRSKSNDNVIMTSNTTTESNGFSFQSFLSAIQTALQTIASGVASIIKSLAAIATGVQSTNNKLDKIIKSNMKQSQLNISPQNQNNAILNCNNDIRLHVIQLKIFIIDVLIEIRRKVIIDLPNIKFLYNFEQMKHDNESICETVIIVERNIFTISTIKMLLKRRHSLSKNNRNRKIVTYGIAQMFAYIKDTCAWSSQKIILEIRQGK